MIWSIIVSMSTYSIHLENFRDIKKADIQLKGITVLAGSNGFRKSTISKFFYHFIGSVMKFERKELHELFGFLDDVDTSIRRLLQKVGIFDPFEDEDTIKNKELRIYFEAWQSLYEIKENFGEGSIYVASINIVDTELHKWIRTIDSIRHFIQKLDSTDVFSELTNVFTKEKQKEIIQDGIISNADAIMEFLITFIQEKHRQSKAKLKERSEKVILNMVRTEFDAPSEDSYDIQKNNYSLKQHGKIEDIQKCNSIYIIPTHDMENKSEISAYLHKEYDAPSEDSNIYSLFVSDDFLRGDIKLQNGKLRFTQNGNSYPLEDCASGINSVAQLFLAYKGGLGRNKSSLIGKDDIVIIDEPEVHLHPSWIVEYARIIVELRKETEAIFLIATHSPSMVSALKYISEAKDMDIGDEVLFYLSKKVEGEPDTYEFTSQGQDIDEIYGSFNEDMDKIEDYTE